MSRRSPSTVRRHRHKIGTRLLMASCGRDREEVRPEDLEVRLSNLGAEASRNDALASNRSACARYYVETKEDVLIDVGAQGRRARARAAGSTAPNAERPVRPRSSYHGRGDRPAATAGLGAGIEHVVRRDRRRGRGGRPRHGPQSVVASQVELHAPFGGVVPEIASRAHVELVHPVIDRTRSSTPVSTLDDIDAYAGARAARGSRAR